MKFFVFSCLIASLLHLGFSCSCIFSSFGSRYCSAKRSIRGRVIANFSGCNTEDCADVDPFLQKNFFYIVRVLDVFKGPPVKDNLLYLSTSPGTCRTSFKVDEEYLLNLSESVTSNSSCPREHYPRNRCDFTIPWDGLSQDLKEFVYTNSRTDQSLCNNNTIPTAFVQKK